MSKVILPTTTIIPKVIVPKPTTPTTTAPKPTIQQVINDPRELAEETPKPIVYNISLQLGDIIQLDAPSNSSLHDKIYFIKFINKEKIVLIDAAKIITLTIGLNGKLEEESISNILLLSRHKSPSFIVQNNLEIKK